ncbi:hypothetical protein ONS95_003613 [Cadophora gregata]|uniref:uncharacterized protein n=1 Tax=Cadophora gregata TaxID=51156 RepID=UPI0026DB0FDC|nr:uncharacterized protein ONS95_003613 [Cadophora gregata]KAK0106895.1 hypothetical protein ONS95_003613 [Cadophora gregata]
MLITKPLLWLITAVSVVAAIGSNTCSSDLKPQPIGIDFGSNVVVATYAYTSKNITTISWLSPPTYHHTIFRLRLEDYQAKQTAKILWGINKSESQTLKTLKTASQAYLSPILTPLSSKFTALKKSHPVLEDTISWLSGKFSFLFTFVRSRFSKSWFNEDLTLQDVKNEFISILNETKLSVAASHPDPSNLNTNTTITFAIFSVPDFFNQTLCDLVIESALEAGIESLPVTIARTVAAGIGAQVREVLDETTSHSSPSQWMRSQYQSQSKAKNSIWDANGLTKLNSPSKNPEPTSLALNLPSKRPEKILIIDQSRFYAALRTYEVEDRSLAARRALASSRANAMRNGTGYGDEDWDGERGVFLQKYLPLDPYGSQIIDTKLYQRVLEQEVVLKEEIRWGAGEERLRDEVARGRLLIKDALDREVLGFFGKRGGEGGDGDREEEMDRHHEEWPLNLNGWSSSGRDLQVTLKWEDVAAVEEHFVDKFAEAVHMFLVTLRRIRTSNDQTTHPETIHTVVILTDHTDGQLLTRPVRQALGQDVKIVGGSSASVTLAAEGAAKLALRRVGSWEEMVRRERLMEFLESGEGEGDGEGR